MSRDISVIALQVSYTFSRDFISLLLKHGNVATDFGRTEVLLKGLRRVSSVDRQYEQSRLCRVIKIKPAQLVLGCNII